MSGSRVTAGDGGDTDLRVLTRRVRGAVAEARQRADVVHAWGLLRERRSDGRKGSALPYTEPAIQAFEALRAASPEDPSVLHHLAIAYHARAWDLDLQDDVRAKEAWLRSLACWSALINVDAWWDLLKAKLAVTHPQSDPELVTEVRRDLKDQLVGVHKDFIVFYWRQAAHVRSRTHKEITVGAFPDKRSSLEERLLEAISTDVAAAVAAGGYATAIEVIENFLQLYPDNVRALAELVRTSARWFEAIRTEGGYEKGFSLDRRARVHGLRLVRSLRRLGSSRGALAVNADLETLALNVAIWAIHRTDDLFADSPARRAADHDVKALETAVWWCRLAWRSTVPGSDLRMGFVKCAIHYGAAAHDRMEADMSRMSSDLLKRLVQRCLKYLEQALQAHPDHANCAQNATQLREELRLLRVRGAF